MNEHDQKLANVLLDAMMLDWQNNGNLSADAVRDACLQALSEVLDEPVDVLLALIEQRILDRQ